VEPLLYNLRKKPKKDEEGISENKPFTLYSQTSSGT
jgi:hypothetical protein